MTDFLSFFSYRTSSYRVIREFLFHCFPLVHWYGRFEFIGACNGSAVPNRLIFTRCFEIQEISLWSVYMKYLFSVDNLGVNWYGSYSLGITWGINDSKQAFSFEKAKQAFIKPLHWLCYYSFKYAYIIGLNNNLKT